MRPKLQFRAVVVLGLVLALGGCVASPTSQPADRPTTTSVPPTTTAVPEPRIDILPLGLPGMSPNEPAGEYGWTGRPGARGWLHRVFEGRETQLVFGVKDDCFTRSPTATPTAVTVAGLDALVIEPYVGESRFTSFRGETTAAYALPIDDRTLCVYLSWDPAITAAELSAAREVVESIRGEPYGGDGIRINFTLPAGWDTG